MSLQTIPTLVDGTTSYRERVRLEGQDWLFDLVFNARRSRWSLSVLDLEGNAVITGQPVVCGLPLFARKVGGPPGQLFAISLDLTYEAPGLQELGNRVILFYVTSDDELLQ